MRSAESVFSEVYYFSSRILNDNRLYKSYLAIYDDTFTVSRKRLVKFCSYMIESKLNIIPWKCESRIDILDEEIIQLMKEAGCFALPGTELNKNAEQYNISIHSNNWDDFSLMKVIISTKSLRDIDIRNIYYSIVDEINSIGG